MNKENADMEKLIQAAVEYYNPSEEFEQKVIQCLDLKNYRCHEDEKYQWSIKRKMGGFSGDI